MRKSISWVFLRLLVITALFMLIWGVLGFIEYFSGFSIIPLQNPDFPKGTQFVHWFLITASGVLFLLGYLTKSKKTPTAMLVVYAMLATMCTIQTFDMMTSANRYIAYIIEIMGYIGISMYLLTSKHSQQHFNE